MIRSFLLRQRPKKSTFHHHHHLFQVRTFSPPHHLFQVRTFSPPPHNIPPPSWNFPFLLAIGGFCSVTIGGFFLNDRNRRQRTGQNGTVSSDAESLRILGRVLFSIVNSQEQEQGVEDKVVSLLQELTSNGNQSTHDAIASQAIPLLLRAVTSSKVSTTSTNNTSTKKTKIKTKTTTKDTALQALDNLAQSEPIVESIVLEAFKTQTLIPLLQILGNVNIQQQEYGTRLGNKLDTLTLAASVGVYATNLKEIQQLTDIIATTTVPSIRRFALRAMEDTVRQNNSNDVTIDLDWNRLLSCVKDELDTVALLSLIHTVTTPSTSNVTTLNAFLQTQVGAKEQGKEATSLLDFLVEWSSKIPTTSTTSTSTNIKTNAIQYAVPVSSRNETARDLSTVFALKILCNVTSASADSTSSVLLEKNSLPSNILNATQIETLHEVNQQCMNIVHMHSTLPPDTNGTATNKMNKLQRHVTLLANIILNSISNVPLQQQETWREKWSDSIIEWLRNDANVSLQKIASEILTALTMRDVNTRQPLTPTQYNLLENWLYIGTTCIANAAPVNTYKKVTNELRQSVNKLIKNELMTHEGGQNDNKSETVSGSGGGVGGSSGGSSGTGINKKETLLMERKKRLSTMGNSGKQSHVLKALSLVFESPEDVIQQDDLDHTTQLHSMEKALQTFNDLKLWSAIEHLMDLDDVEDEDTVGGIVGGIDDGIGSDAIDSVDSFNSSKEKTNQSNATKYINGRQHDYLIKNCARLVANVLACDLALFNGTMNAHYVDTSTKKWQKRFQKWLSNDSRKENRTDLKITHHARRAAQHLLLYDTILFNKAKNKDSTEKTFNIIEKNNIPLYSDHLFPVHGIDVDNDFVSTSLSSSFGSLASDGIDIVFVHGIAGGAFMSWNQELIAQQHNYSQFWPGLWLPADLERRTKRSARVLTFGYEARPIRTIKQMDETSSPPLDMEEQAASLLQKLKLAKVGVGARPVVFVCHSLGGLVVKKTLMLSHMESKTSGTTDVLGTNTKACVFYSTPHKGSPLMDLLLQPADTVVAAGLAGIHPIVMWLSTTHQPTLDLNEAFGVVYGNRSMSIGETKKETLPGLLNLDILAISDMMDWIFDDSGVIQIVPSNSAYPGYGLFEEIPNSPHTTINKPTSLKDRRYLAMIEYVAGRV